MPARYSYRPPAHQNERVWFALLVLSTAILLIGIALTLAGVTL